MSALEYEDLPRMQSLTPEPDDTGSLKDDGMVVVGTTAADGGADDDIGIAAIDNTDLNLADLCGGSGSGSGAAAAAEDNTGGSKLNNEIGEVSRSHSPLYNYNKYNLKVNSQNFREFTFLPMHAQQAKSGE